VAVMVEVLTDNRNRTGSDVRSTFSRNGGSLAEPGAVAWQFQRKGLITVPSSVPEDDLMLVAAEAGADDISDEDDVWLVTTPPSELQAVRSALEQAGITVEASDLSMVAANLVALESATEAKRVLGLIEALEDNDDVQAVHANFDIPDQVLQAVTA